MKKITVSALSVIIALTAGSAFANEHGAKKSGEHHKRGERMLKETDTDKDGAISKSEWEAKGNKMFTEMDANNDGKLTKEEMKAAHEKKKAEWQARKAAAEAKGETTPSPAKH